MKKAPKIEPPKPVRGPYHRYDERRYRYNGGEMKKLLPEHIGAAIRQARIAAELTQEALATRAEIGRTLLAQLETGKKPVIRRNWDKLRKIMPALSKVKVAKDGMCWTYREEDHRLVLAAEPKPAKKASTPKRTNRRLR